MYPPLIDIGQIKMYDNKKRQSMLARRLSHEYWNLKGSRVRSMRFPFILRYQRDKTITAIRVPKAIIKDKASNTDTLSPPDEQEEPTHQLSR